MRSVRFCWLAGLLMTGWSSGLLPNLDYPYLYDGDGLSYSWRIQRIIEGWTFNNPRSGYPFGSNFLDYPSSDFGNHLILKLIGSLTGEYHSAFNLYFLLGFAVTFIVSFCVLRAIGLALPFAVTAATLFNFLTFHFLRLEHLFYTWYFVVPIYYYIALKMYGSNLYNEKSRTSLTTKLFYAFCLMSLCSFGVYYALFGLITLLVVTISGIILSPNSRKLKCVLLATRLVVVGVLSNLTPSLMHQYENGSNPEVAQRNAAEAETYGFKFVQLVLPRRGHRSEYLAQIYEEYSTNSPLVNENLSSALGIVGSLGLIALLVVIFVNLAGKHVDETLRVTALVVLVLFMFRTIGGFGSVFSQVISSSIRGWNRISIFIGFGALLGLFTLLQTEINRRFSERRGLFVSSAIAIILLLGGLYDQTVSPCDSCNEQTRNSFHMDREFVRSIENALPPGSAIYQLPYMPFPEVPPLHRLQAYDLAVGFLHSVSLHWSYAGMKGREGDIFYRYLSQETIERQLEVIKRLGFAGVYIDRRGYEDNGQAVIGDLTALLGKPPELKRADGEVAFFRFDWEPVANLEDLNAAQIMQKAGYIADHLGVHYEATMVEGIDFTRRDLPTFVKNIQGLSGPEPWGRWSDANLAQSVRIDLRDKLPSRFTLVFLAHPFGPNTGQELTVLIGSQTHQIKMHGASEYRLTIDLGDEKVTHIEFLPPQPTSPKQVGMSEDKRKLGIGFVHLRFEV